MSPRPDPPVLPDPEPLGPDKRLWLGLASGFATIVLLALAIHRFVPATPLAPRTPAGAGASGPANTGTLNGSPPLMTRPQLLENQQAMPELREFDAQTPPAGPANGSAPPGAPNPPHVPAKGAPGP